MGDDDDDDDGGPKQKGPPWLEFDCPECTANNPNDDGFAPGDELTCLYCGLPWKVRETESGYRLVEP